MHIETALRMVMNDAEKQMEYWRGELKNKPLQGWSDEKHIDYCHREIDEASKARHYCFIRLMQINPD